MGLFSNLFGSKPDPTASWAAPAAKPGIDLTGKVGAMRLGDALEKARSIGRPARFEPGEGTDADLEYDGYHLEFIDGRLACAAFDVEGGGSVSVGEFDLTAATSPLDVQVWLGDPTSDSSEEKLRWIDYERDGITLALEFENEKLAYVQLYNQHFA